MAANNHDVEKIKKIRQLVDNSTAGTLVSGLDGRRAVWRWDGYSDLTGGFFEAGTSVYVAGADLGEIKFPVYEANEVIDKLAV